MRAAQGVVVRAINDAISERFMTLREDAIVRRLVRPISVRL